MDKYYLITFINNKSWPPGLMFTSWEPEEAKWGLSFNDGAALVVSLYLDLIPTALIIKTRLKLSLQWGCYEQEWLLGDVLVI